MFSLLLVAIYLAFISLGLPDSMLGSAWPVMHTQFSVPVSYAGLVSMIIAGSTIISSLLNDKFLKKLGTGVIVVISVALTAIAIFGFSISATFWQVCLFAIPYGMGAGSVDATLNNFVALHYKSKHMSWLHCFWGIGAMTGPYIMGMQLTKGLQWTSGYRFIGFIQVILVVILFISLPLWKKVEGTKTTQNTQQKQKSSSLISILKISGVKEKLITFFCYCAVETTTGLWASTYLVFTKNISPEEGAKYASLLYVGITFGRLAFGFISDRLGDRKMIELGQFIALIGIILMVLPCQTIISVLGLIIIGIGCAPIFPSLIHATPDNFGVENSQSVMGVQMACAYIGSTFMPTIFGFLANHISVKLYPFYLLTFMLLMIIMTKVLYSKHRHLILH